MANQAIRQIPVKVSWRDVIELDIADPELKKKTENFLTKLERSAFRYETKDPVTGKVTQKELSGQEMLQKIAETQKMYREAGLSDALGARGMMRNGKFVISQHDRQFDGRVENGCNTAFIGIGNGIMAPVGISLGLDYLRGARFSDTGGRWNPVTIEGVLSNELAHLAYRTTNEQFSNQIEGIISVALGGRQRSSSENVDFRRNGNGGIQSLLEKAPEPKANLKAMAPVLELQA